MNIRKISRRLVVTVLIIVGLIVVLIVSLNLILQNLIENKISKALMGKDELKYDVTFERTTVNIVTGNVAIKGFKVVPDSVYFSKYINGETPSSGMINLDVPQFLLNGLDLIKIVKSSEISINEIRFDEATFIYYTGAKFVKTDSIPSDSVPPQSKRLNLDSIQLSGIEGLAIGKIEFVRNNLKVINVIKKDTLIEASELDLSFDGLQLTSLEGEEDYFRFSLDNLRFELSNEKIGLPGDWYFLSFGKLIVDKKQSIILIKDMKLYPQMTDYYKMAQKLIYTSEIYNIGIKEIAVYNPDIRRLINKGMFYCDSIAIDSLDLDMQKDKRFPWNYNKRPQLPNHQLRKMKFPLYAGKVSITDSRLYYHEIMEGAKEQMEVTLEKMNVSIENVTSVKDSIATGKPLTIQLNSKLMGVADLEAHIIMELNSVSDTFNFYGSLGSAKLETFNAALQPAMGLKIEGGQLKGVTFAARANNYYSKGEMIMMYDSLKATVLTSDEENKKKFLSWIANTVVHSFNPGKKGKLRTAQMSFERVEYKGLGNFLWKTLQSGIVNTLLPTGKTSKDYPVNSNPEKNKKKSKKK